MFDVHQDFRDEDGVYDEDAWESYRDVLLEEFAQSEEGSKVAHDQGGLHWAGMYLDYAMSHLGSSPLEISSGDQAEILFELIPRKVVTEPESAGEIVAEVRAFWQFMGRRYQHPPASRLVSELDDEAIEDLEEALDDEGNFGMGKSLMSLARRQGFDISDEADLQRFMLAYNLSLAQQHAPNPFREPTEDQEFSGEKLRGQGWTKPVFNKQDKRKKAKAQRQAKKKNRR
jgi:hypothetical protein